MIHLVSWRSGVVSALGTVKPFPTDSYWDCWLNAAVVGVRRMEEIRLEMETRLAIWPTKIRYLGCGLRGNPFMGRVESFFHLP